ncbi:phage tail tape measure protein [Salmonella enterica]
MTDIATISLRVNTGSLEKGRDELTRFRGAASDAAASADKFNNQANQSLGAFTQQLTTARSLMMSLAGVMGSAFAVSSVVSQADAWGQTVSRMKMATSSAKELATVQAKLMEISDRTYKSIDEQTELFIRSSTSMKELGYSAEQTVNFIDSVSSSLTINAASAEQGARAITALSRAMVSGKLRGLEWEAVMEVMPTAISDVSRAMGISENAVKSMARSGELSMKQFVAAMLEAQQRNAELTEAMPTTIGDALTRISNHWKVYIGDANSAYGVTQSVSMSLNKLAENIDGVITVSAILAGVGLSRFLGNMVLNLKAGIVSASALRNEQIRLATAELASARATQVQANAQAMAARYDVARAKTVEALRLAYTRLDVAQRSQAAALTTVTTAQTALNASRAVASTLLTRGLALVGGAPGLFIAAAGALFAWKARIEQANQSARDYIATLDELRSKISGMKLTETYDNIPKAEAALASQTREVNAQANKVRELQSEVKALQSMLADPGPTVGGFMINHLMSTETATNKLAEATVALRVEQARLEEKQLTLKDVQETINDLRRQERELIRQQTVGNESYTQSVLMMTGANSQFNTVLGLGNELLNERNRLIKAPLRLPDQDLTKEQTAAMKQAERNLELARTKGDREKQVLKTQFKLKDLGLDKGDPTQATAYWRMYNAEMEAWDLDEQAKPAKKPGATKTTDAEKSAAKLENSYERIIKQQREQIALDGQHTELAKMRYQLTEGELATLSAAQKATLLQNAALIDQVKYRRQLVEYERQLVAENQNARDSNSAELTGYGEGERTRGRMQERLAIRQEFLEKDRELLKQYQDGSLEEAAWRQSLALNRKYLDERLADQEDFWDQLDAQREDWTLGIAEGLANWVDDATNYAELAAQATSNAISGLVDTMADALNDSKADWKDWGVSVLKTIEKILLNAALVDGIKGLGGAIGGGFGDFLSGLVKNAKGGVYDSPSLSAYRNQVVTAPTFFAFAKGAGVMGEAGPEAIMPLTRTANGQLGVRSTGSTATTQAPVVHISITGDGQPQTRSSSGWEQFAAEIGQFVDQRYRENMTRDTAPGGAVWNTAHGTR